MSRRLEKIGSQMKRILGEIFIKKSSDFDIGLISIDDIVISRDLSQAKVWVSFIGKEDRRTSFKHLLKNTREIQSLFYKQMPIKRVPKIQWQLSDDNLDDRIRMEQLLDDIKRDQTKDSGV